MDVCLPQLPVAMPHADEDPFVQIRFADFDAEAVVEDGLVGVPMDACPLEGALVVGGRR